MSSIRIVISDIIIMDLLYSSPGPGRRLGNRSVLTKGSARVFNTLEVAK